MDKQYDPKKVESKIYQLWEESGFFDPDKLPPLARGKKRKEPFCIIMPPPNANGLLHLGHAVFVVLEDILTRFERLRGKAALWLPGADHAGFETQVVYDKKLEKEGRSRFDIAPEQLYSEMLEFTLANKKTMEEQLKKLGASCDWSREKFTLDEDIVEIVYQTFEKLKKDGLLYQGQRIVNWCPKHQTSLSDLEVKYEERQDPFYYIKYGPLELGTVRLETKFGDTAVAVNPKDKRYQKYVGQEIEIETLLGKRKIKVIADEAVDMNFGTGVVKITPAHDADDFAIWQRHEQEMPLPLQVIDRFGKLTKQAGPYQGMKVLDARQKIAQDMAERRLLNPAKTEHDYKHNVAVCYKCGSLIEPMILDNQWFVKMTDKPKSGGDSLRDAAVMAVKESKIKFIPKRFEKIFFHWMKNIKDWNISRQIPWGIKIPEAGTNDVFDTWFSSGQWPFATLLASGRSKSKIKNQKSKIPETADDFERFYPTSVMETGWDILFFWVARMIMLGIYATGRIPFSKVVLHGLVRDKDRQKMSKSKGNVIDPMGVVNEHGADALRMALVFSVSTGSDIAFSEDKIIAQKRFANKIWNAARFVIGSLGKDFNPKKIKPHYSKNDKWILGELDKAAKKITKDLENYKFHEAAQAAYHFFWHSFCDKCIEDVKARIKKPAGDQDKKTAQYVLWKVLTDSLKFLHPFMPFITEEIYQQIPHRPKETLIIEDWPK